jgi:hypothetical protein
LQRDPLLEEGKSVSQASRRTSPLGAVLLLGGVSLGLTSGCYTYAVAAREPPPNSQQVPIDRMNPQTSYQWQYFWGLGSEPVWSPLNCTNGQQDASGHCLKGAIDPCHGQGIGFYEVDVAWHTELLKLVTLGTVSAVRTTFYCSTVPRARPSEGPQDASAPGPTPVTTAPHAIEGPQ